MNYPQSDRQTDKPTGEDIIYPIDLQFGTPPETAFGGRYTASMS